jgi:uncharacterized membrane protein YccC
MHNQFPIDFDALQRGMVLSIKELEQVLGLKYQPGETTWAFAVMGLQSQICNQTDLTAVVDGGAIRILTDAEASQNNYRAVQLHTRRIYRRNRKLLQVDRQQLTPDQQSEHESRVRVSGSIVSALIGATRKVIGQPTTPLPSRLTPAIDLHQ